jgi:uncharacterized membrane protein YkvA (DUF1232 family)
MPSLCLETITQERALAQDHNGAMSNVKSDLLTDRLRVGMVAFALDVVFLYRLFRHPKTRWYVRGLLFLPVIYLCSPIQLIPNFIPVLGQVDDVFVIWVTKKVARNLMDEKVWRECHSAAAATMLSFTKQKTVCKDKKMNLNP